MPLPMSILCSCMCYFVKFSYLSKDRESELFTILRRAKMRIELSAAIFGSIRSKI